MWLFCVINRNLVRVLELIACSCFKLSITEREVYRVISEDDSPFDVFFC